MVGLCLHQQHEQVSCETGSKAALSLPWLVFTGLMQALSPICLALGILLFLQECPNYVPPSQCWEKHIVSSLYYGRYCQKLAYLIPLQPTSNAANCGVQKKVPSYKKADVTMK